MVNFHPVKIHVPANINIFCRCRYRTCRSPPHRAARPPGAPSPAGARSPRSRSGPARSAPSSGNATWTARRWAGPPASASTPPSSPSHIKTTHTGNLARTFSKVRDRRLAGLRRTGCRSTSALAGPRPPPPRATAPARPPTTPAAAGRAPPPPPPSLTPPSWRLATPSPGSEWSPLPPAARGSPGWRQCSGQEAAPL